MLSPACADATGALLSALLGALERAEWVQRQLFPPQAGRLAQQLTPHAERLSGPLAAFEAQTWPDDLRFLRERLAQVARQALELIEAFGAAAGTGEPIGLYRALRRLGPLQQARSGRTACGAASCTRRTTGPAAAGSRSTCPKRQVAGNRRR